MSNGTYVTILDWMSKVTSSIEERDALAIIYGYSQGKQGKFEGTYQYIADWLMCSKRTAIKVIGILEEKGLVSKEQLEVAGICVNRYRVNKEKVDELVELEEAKEEETKRKKEGCTDFTPREIASPPVKTLHSPREIASPNNTIVYNSSIQDKSFIEQKNNNKDACVPACEATEKNLFGEEEKTDKKKTAREIKEEDRLKREAKFKEQLEVYKVSNGGEYDDDMVDNFFNYWSEPNPSGAKMRFELQQTFDIKRRLVTWSSKSYNQNGNNGNKCYGSPLYGQRNGNSGSRQYIDSNGVDRRSYARVTELSESVFEGKL